MVGGAPLVTYSPKIKCRVYATVEGKRCQMIRILVPLAFCSHTYKVLGGAFSCVRKGQGSEAVFTFSFLSVCRWERVSAGVGALSPFWGALLARFSFVRAGHVRLTEAAPPRFPPYPRPVRLLTFAGPWR